MLDLLEEFRSILAAFESGGIEFAVCGGLAVAIHGRPRATLDVDLLVPETSLERWEHGCIPVVSRAGLVQMKQLRGSGQDRDDIVLLEAEGGD